MNPTHLIIHTIQFQPGTVDEAAKLFEEAVPKLAGHFSGWCGARLSVDRETNQAVSVGAWADIGQMTTFLNQPEFAQAMGAFAKYFAAPPQTLITEVVTAVGPRG